MSATPRVTIGLPVYNAERFMVETIETILDQDYVDFELIISDNASTDRTAEIAKKYVDRDPRVRYVRNPTNLGAARNYNQLVELARGEYFKWAGYDDLLAPTYLSRCVEVLERAPEVVIAYPKTLIIDEHGTVVREHVDDLHLDSPDPAARVAAFAKRFRLCNPCFGLHRREVLLTTSLIAPYVSSDVALLVELALRGQWHEVPERLFQRRIHETSSIQGTLSLAQTAQWFRPDLDRPRAPRLRMVGECLLAIRRAPLPASTRLRAASAFVSTWVVRQARVRGGACKQAVRHGVLSVRSTS